MKLIALLGIMLCVRYSLTDSEDRNSKLETYLEEAYCNVTCNIEKNSSNYMCIPKLNYRNNSESFKVNWLCRDEYILSFNWTRNEDAIFVIEYKNTFRDWTYHETTTSNWTVIEGLGTEGNHQIRIWEATSDGYISGPYTSEKVETLVDLEYYPSAVRDFKLNGWEYDGQSLYSANFEWTPSEDRQCFYEFLVEPNELTFTTKDIENTFIEKVPGFYSGQIYRVNIYSKFAESPAIGLKSWIEIEAPNCLESYKTVDMCLPNLPDVMNVSESLSIYYQEFFENATYDVNVTWSLPEYKPDNYTISLLIFKEDAQNLVQNATGDSRSVVFYNVTLTAHYWVLLKMSSKAGTTVEKRTTKMIDHNIHIIKKHETPIGRIAILIYSSAVVLCFTIISLISCFSYKRFQKAKQINQSFEKSFESHLTAMESGLFNIVDDKWKINSDEITIGELIGEGVFGVVFKGMRRKENVAIKMLKGHYTSDEIRQFKQEIEIMKSVGNHPNIVSFIGCCIKPEYSCPLLIVEYCDGDNLQTHLRSLWSAISDSLTNSTNYENYPKIEFSNFEYQFPNIVDLFKTFINYAHQIAAGMEHLENKKVVHRDLAARNILMHSHGLVKVSDFGLSRDVYVDDTYVKTSTGKLPVKWMAIESLTHQIFTTQSDVWSFGVLLWEIVTFCAIPYVNIHYENLLPHLLRGHRLGCPEHCNPKLYNVMLSCWKKEPCERPTFKELVISLKSMIKEDGPYIPILDKSKSNVSSQIATKESLLFI